MVFDTNARLLKDVLKPVHSTLMTWLTDNFVTDAGVAKHVVWASPMRAWSRHYADNKSLMLDDPAIAVGMSDIQLDRSRFSMGQVLYAWASRYVKAPDSTACVKIFAAPYKMTFQLDYWADTRVEINQFLTFLLYKFRPHMNFDVNWKAVDISGNEYDATCVGGGIFWIQSTSDVSDLEYGGGKRDLRVTVMIEAEFSLPVAVTRDRRIEKIFISTHLWNPVHSDSTFMNQFVVLPGGDDIDSTSRPWGVYDDTYPGHITNRHIKDNLAD